MIRADRELLAELARVNTDVVPLAMSVMDGSATAAAQHEMAGRLIDVGQRLRERATRTAHVIEGRLVGEDAQATAMAVPNQEP